MKNEWENYGDVNFFDYGGTMIKRAGDDEFEYFHLIVDGEDKYAFHGTLMFLSDYVDDLNKEARDYGYKNGREWLDKDPEFAASYLLENYGYGVLEFSPTNHDGLGAYSLNYADFLLTDEQLSDFMREVAIPEEYIPEIHKEEIDR